MSHTDDLLMHKTKTMLLFHTDGLLMEGTKTTSMEKESTVVRGQQSTICDVK